jgi:hypothetical protein
VIRQLRASADDGDGYLRPDDWLRLAALGRSQLEYLEHEFPDAQSVRQHQVLLRVVAGLTERERAALARPEGATWSDWSRETQRRLLVVFTPAEARELRIVFQWLTGEAPPRLRLFVGARSAPVRPVEVPFRPRPSE